MVDVPKTNKTDNRLPRWRLVLVQTALVFAIFALFGAWPVPDVNEPHYLIKARHAWQSDWLASDLFVDSPAAHHAFNLTFGGLTLAMSFDTAAWTGRIVVWLLQAWGWTLLSRALFRASWCAPVSAGLFVMLNETTHMAGEWVVGGLEAKGVAYALAFFALAAFVRRRWNRACVAIGAATAFHVLVGGWTAVATAAAWLAVDRRAANRWRLAVSLVIGAALAACGVIPALLLNRNTGAQVSSDAQVIYVFERLPHHLVPQSFPTAFVLRFLLMAAVWTALVVFTAAGPRRRRLRAVVGASLGIALLGVVIALATMHNRELSASLLRYYWFRLADVFLPMGLAFEVIALAASQRRAREWISQGILLGATMAVGVYLTLQIIARDEQGRPRADREDRIANYDAWRDACAWIRSETPTDARFLTPRMAQTFKWYAQRGEVVTWKDVPQDPTGIVEWRRRLDAIHAARDPQSSSRWIDSLAELATDEVAALAAKYDAHFVLTTSEPRLALPVVFQNNSYVIYRVSSDAAGSQ